MLPKTAYSRLTVLCGLFLFFATVGRFMGVFPALTYAQTAEEGCAKACQPQGAPPANDENGSPGFPESPALGENCEWNFLNTQQEPRYPGVPPETQACDGIGYETLAASACTEPMPDEGFGQDWSWVCVQPYFCEGTFMEIINFYNYTQETKYYSECEPCSKLGEEGFTTDPDYDGYYASSDVGDPLGGPTWWPDDMI